MQERATSYYEQLSQLQKLYVAIRATARSLRKKTVLCNLPREVKWNYDLTGEASHRETNRSAGHGLRDVSEDRRETEPFGRYPPLRRE